MVVVDLNNEGVFDIGNFYTKAEYSPFDGWKYTGEPIMTIVSGKTVIDKI